MRVRDVIRVLKKHEFRLDRSKGRVRHFEGVVNGERRLVTVPGKDEDELPNRVLVEVGGVR